MRPIKIAAIVMSLFSVMGLKANDTKPSVLICYGKVNPDLIQGYKYVILESEQFSAFDIKLIKENNEIVLGYISMGEVSPSRYYYDKLKLSVLGKNKLWDSYYLDPRLEITKSTLLDFVAKIKGKGFDGLFLDTVDTYAKWGPYANLGSEMVAILKLIKEKHPDLHLMQNAGLSLVPSASKYINSLAIESIVTNYSFEGKKYRMRNKTESDELMKELKGLNESYSLPVVLIEYADNAKLEAKIKHLIEPLKWDYFIGEIELQTIPKFK